jgi:aerobic carbon-monoxide dehydrogenase large subunit
VVVVAETVKLAKDAAEAVIVEIDTLPAVTDAPGRGRGGAPLVHGATPGNVVLDFHHGDAAAFENASAKAAHVTRRDVRNSRVVVCPMEPGSAIGDYDTGTERWTLRLGCQGVFEMRQLLMGPLKTTLGKIRVLTGNVGGSSGMKASCYPEYPRYARAAGEWTDERGESFLSESYCRDLDKEQEIAFDAGGKILALLADRLPQHRRLPVERYRAAAHWQHRAMEPADQIRSGPTVLPGDVPQVLSASHVAEGPPFAYPNGCFIAEVEVDPETGVM